MRLFLNPMWLKNVVGRNEDGKYQELQKGMMKEETNIQSSGANTDGKSQHHGNGKRKDHVHVSDVESKYINGENDETAKKKKRKDVESSTPADKEEDDIEVKRSYANNRTIAAITDDEKSSVVERAKSAYKSKNPFVAVVLQPSYIYPTRRLCLPKKSTARFRVDAQEK